MVLASSKRPRINVGLQLVSQKLLGSFIGRNRVYQYVASNVWFSQNKESVSFVQKLFDALKIILLRCKAFQSFDICAVIKYNFVTCLEYN